MNDKVNIKICGITRIEETKYLNEAEVDYAGFVFYEKSRRNVTTEDAMSIMSELNKDIKRVAVTVSPDLTLIKRIEDAGFDLLQVHGDMDMEVLNSITIPVWRAVNTEDVDNAFEKLRFYENIDEVINKKISGILMDAPDFGSGKPFNWHRSRRLLQAGDRSSPFFDKLFILAGGLNSDNVAEGIRLFNPDVVDVSSGVEGDVGKSRDRILEFVKAVRSGQK
ncbi:MAG: phosphoribosylanthranilate isomerase [Lachnospiraceae bacterium]|nr:phosphoribosylanthranilate isomerase [Lachnospiraceae bacterium]